MTGLRLPLLMTACLVTAVVAWRDHSARDPAGPPAKIEPRVSILKSAAVAVPPRGSEPVTSSGNPLAATELSKLAAWIERPLFAPSRRPPPPPVKSVARRPAAALPAPAPKPPPPRYELIGVVSDGSRSIGLLRLEGKSASIMVEIGDSIGGWRVAEIGVRSVLLVRDDGTMQNVTIAQE